MCNKTSRTKEVAAMAPKDAEKVITASTCALALADGAPTTDRVLREYVGDARIAVVAGLKEAKRQGWELAELLAALESASAT